MIRGIVGAVLLTLCGLPAWAAGTINSLQPIAPFPLVDPGCPVTSTENLWITHGNGVGTDYKITPTQLGYVFQGTNSPGCPFRFQGWWNTSVTPPQFEVYDGLQWVVATALDTANHQMIYLSPELSGTVSGAYTLGGTVTITSPTISDPELSGTVTGSYTLGGTVAITSPTISNPTISGTISGEGVLPLTGLAQIASHTIVGNTSGGTTYPSAAYTVSSSGTTLPALSGSFQAQDLLVAADVNGTIEDGSSVGTVYLRQINSGGGDHLIIQNGATASGTISDIQLVTGSPNAAAIMRLTDDPTAVNRTLALSVGSGVGGGMTFDASGPGSTSVLKLIGGSAAGGIALQGTPEVLYTHAAAGQVDFRIFNGNSTAAATAQFIAQTGSASATVSLYAQDGGSPFGFLLSGTGMLSGLKLGTLTGPITLLPTTATPPQVLVANLTAGGETRLAVSNASSVAGTKASINVATGSASGFFQSLDGATPQIQLSASSGATGGVSISSNVGPITLQPSTTSSGASSPQTAIVFNNSASLGELSLSNPFTTGGTVAALLLSTGTASSTMTASVAESSHVAALFTGAGVTGGLTVDSSGSGAVADLTLKSGRYITLTPATNLYINNLATVAASTGKDFLCIDNSTHQVYEGTGASCN